jgi:hypothetical protein
MMIPRTDPKINLLYSIDYEVYWTENHDESAVLVLPTKALLDLAEDLGIRFTFFADVLCLFRYREEGLDNFVAEAEEQLRAAVRRGHDVQTHLHPHWLRARREDGRWAFEAGDFLLGRLGADEREVYAFTKNLLIQARGYLEGLLKPVSPAYRTIAFRAGGYGIQPHDRAILRALEDSGYLIDSSIVPGMRRATGRNAIDFTRIPDRGNYYLGAEHGIARAVERGVFEIPIAAGTVAPRDFVVNLIGYLRFRTRAEPPLFGCGHSRDLGVGRSANVGTASQSVGRKLHTLLHRWSSLRLPNNPSVMLNVTRNWVERYRDQDSLSLSLLLHPKGLTRSMIDTLRIYHRLIEREFNGKVEFPTFLEVAETLVPPSPGSERR